MKHYYSYYKVKFKITSWIENDHEMKSESNIRKLHVICSSVNEIEKIITETYNPKNDIKIKIEIKSIELIYKDILIKE